MIRRTRELESLAGLLKRHPAAAIVGARQVGKTTLARQFAAGWKGPVTFLDLENPAHLARLDDPLLVLRDLKGLVVIDEVQRRPELFPVLRVLIDRPRNPTRFLVLGSAAPGLLRQSSESLAGRIVYQELCGLALDEVGMAGADALWLRGGFPRSYLARSNAASDEWRRSFIRTFLERDIPQLGSSIAAATLYRFWMMLAHYHGQVWSASEFARSFGVADTTVRSYLDLLASALVVRSLPPWHENLGKRQVKSPKVYIADSGLLHALLAVGSRAALEGHPKVGASWEGFVIQELVRRLGVRREECWFWATHSGAELDLLVVRGERRLGFEVKRTTAPRLTSSMRSSLAALRLDRLYVVHAGEDSFRLGRSVLAVAFRRLLDEVQPLR
jgi:hypothetical protein